MSRIKGWHTDVNVEAGVRHLTYHGESMPMGAPGTIQKGQRARMARAVRRQEAELRQAKHEAQGRPRRRGAAGVTMTTVLPGSLSCPLWDFMG